MYDVNFSWSLAITFFTMRYNFVERIITKTGIALDVEDDEDVNAEINRIQLGV